MNFTPKQFRAIRRAHGLSMPQMAKVLSCSTAYVNSMEKGDFPITGIISHKLVAKFCLTSNRMRAITRHYELYVEPFEKGELSINE